MCMADIRSSLGILIKNIWKTEYIMYTLELLSFFEWTYTAQEQSERAFSLGLAALLGENVYNFGELVSLLCTYICM